MIEQKSWHGRRVFVTGATGMLGSCIVKDLLVRGANVVALVRDHDQQSDFYRTGDYLRTSIVNGCLEDFWVLERAINEHEIDTVIHLGAQPIVDVAHRFPLQTFETNIRGTYHLLEACRVHCALVKRVVIASSDKAYGTQPKLPYTEDTPLQGRYPYEVSKSCADLLAQSYYHTYRLPVAIARCGNIYGGGDLNWSRIVPGTIRAFFHNVRPIIRSDGSFVRDYIYVKDVSGAYLRLAESLDDSRLHGQAFNFSSEENLSVLGLLKLLQRLMGCDHILPDVRNTAQGEIQAQHLESAKAGELLGWKSGYRLDEGLSETITWYQEYLKQRSEIGISH